MKRVIKKKRLPSKVETKERRVEFVKGQLERKDSKELFKGTAFRKSQEVNANEAGGSSSCCFLVY